VSRKVYDALAGRASRMVRAGHTAIADAVYARPEDRAAIERAAAEAGVPFLGVWLDAPDATLISRIEQRRDDASDAGAEVVRLQRAQDLGAIRWHRLDASEQAGDVCQQALALVRGVSVTLHA
jgi:predicted kinase